jgi:hypothetical protein
MGRLHNHGRAAKKCGDLVSLTLGEAEFLLKLSPKFPEYKFGGHELVVH